MVERILIPDAILVEHEHLVGRCISEDHVLIEDVAHPHQFIFNGMSLDLFEIFDVNDKFLQSAKQPTLVEYHLLTVWQQLSLPAKVSLLSPSSWHVCE